MRNNPTPVPPGAATPIQPSSSKSARKVSHAHSQPTPTTARASRSAAQPNTRERRVSDEPAPAHAAEGSAPSPAGTSPFRLELPIIIEYQTGLNPAVLPRHRVLAGVAVRGMAICESLFWVVQQLGNMAESDGWVYSSSDLYEALGCLGAVGQAVAAGASDQAQYLEHVAERLHRGEGGHDHGQT